MQSGVCKRAMRVAIRTESLYSSNHRRRYREKPGKSKGCGGTESRPIPKQAFAGSPARAVGQGIPSPALEAEYKASRHPVGCREACDSHILRTKSTRDRISSLHTSCCLGPNLAHDAAQRSGSHAREALDCVASPLRIAPRIRRSVHLPSAFLFLPSGASTADVFGWGLWPPHLATALCCR